MKNNEHAQKFINYLLGLIDDKAAMSTIRRGAAFPPGEYPPMFPYIVPLVADESRELPYYLTAILFAIHPENNGNGNMGSSFRKINESPSTELRFKQLLQCRQEELGYHLRGAVSLLASKGIPVNYAELFQAIGFWEHPDKFIQVAWAKAFWAADYTKEEENN